MTLLQQVLPRYDVYESHAVEVRATPEQVWQALRAYRYSQSPIFRFLFGLRRLAGAPGQLFRGRRVEAAWNLAESPVLELKPFVKVAEKLDEEIVLGLIGRFWEPAPRPVRLDDGESFLTFDDPTYGRAAMNFRLEPLDAGLTRLSTETRVQVPDPASRRLFRLYWAAIGLFSGLIRVDMLGRIKALAER